MKLFAIIGVLLLALATQSAASKCYKCVGKKDSNCFKEIDLKEVDCGSLGCIRFGNDDGVGRQCGNQVACDIAIKAAEKVGGAITCATCEEDLCNAVGIPKTSFAIIFLAGFVFVQQILNF